LENCYFFFEVFKNIRTQYSAIFKGTHDDDGEDKFNTDKGIDKLRKDELMKIVATQWYSILDTLANGDITKHDEVLKINIIHILNHLVYLKDKNKRNAQHTANT